MFADCQWNSVLLVFSRTNYAKVICGDPSAMKINIKKDPFAKYQTDRKKMFTRRKQCSIKNTAKSFDRAMLFYKWFTHICANDSTLLMNIQVCLKRHANITKRRAFKCIWINFIAFICWDHTQHYYHMN